MPMNVLRALGRWLLRKLAVERREILDDDGSIIAVSVSGPLTAAIGVAVGWRLLTQRNGHNSSVSAVLNSGTHGSSAYTGSGTGIVS